jgi:hypothetical protein
MATVSLTIPDDKLPDLIDAMCDAHHWRDATLDGPRSAFAKTALLRHLQNVYRTWMEKKATEAATTGLDTSITVT